MARNTSPLVMPAAGVVQMPMTALTHEGIGTVSLAARPSVPRKNLVTKSVGWPASGTPADVRDHCQL